MLLSYRLHKSDSRETPVDAFERTDIKTLLYATARHENLKDALPACR